MSHLRLVVASVALTLALLVAASLAPSAELREEVLLRAVQGSKLLAAVGAIAAALAFERGDYLRRAWALQALTMILLLRDVPLGMLPKGALVFGISPGVVHQVFITAANVSGVYATWLLARAWQVAGIELPGSPLRKGLLVGAVILLAAAITGVPLAHNVVAWSSGAPVRLGILASIAGDTLSICLIAPLLLTVLAMRGGMLVWPWGILSASMVCWLLFDAGDLAMQLEALRPAVGAISVATDCSRVLACCLLGAAGLAQRRALDEVREAISRR